MNLNQLFNRMLDNSIEWHSGRIEKWNFVWAWFTGEIPSSVQEQFNLGRDQGILIQSSAPNILYRKLQDDKFLVSKKGQSVDCENVDLWQNNPPGYRDTKNVSMTECKKCQFYRSPKDTKYKYATCAYLQQKRSGNKNPKSAAALSMLSDLTDSVNTAKEILE